MFVPGPARSAQPSGSPYPEDALSGVYRQAAASILAGAPELRGYCLVFGAGTGRLAWELRASGRFSVIGVEEDAAKVAAGRARLHAADQYGDRIALHHGALTNLRYRDYAAALVVSDTVISEGVCPGSAAEMFRMVRPDGGVALIGQPASSPQRLPRERLAAWLERGNVNHEIREGAAGTWAYIRRGPLPGAGTWTHNLADVGNTACSGDTRTSDTVTPLWFGEPGPALMTDRHWRPQAPLYRDGRLIIPGNDRILCVDAYNGARLWDLALPNSSRIAMMRDAGFLALAPDALYAVVGDRCLKVAAQSGEIMATFKPPQATGDWGYLAVQGRSLFGSRQMPGASYVSARTARGAVGNQLGRGNDRLIVTSKSLFRLDRDTGEAVWSYDGSSAIANATVCLDGRGVYFVESVAPGVVSDPDGRVALAAFAEGGSEHVVCLDRDTGELLWRHQRDLPVQHVMHLACAQGVLVASGCRTFEGDFWYHLRAYRTSDGEMSWQRDIPSGFGTRDTDHGKQDKHPMIIGNAVYLKQGSFALATGEPTGFRFPTSNCAECSSSLKHIFSRDRGCPSVFDLKGTGTGAILCAAMRPGCYISIIPAGGIIMLPAFSAGCTCPYTLQTTIAWLPR